ncbi:MAG: transporter related [Thermoleophilia bacterium]|nr:transporter related [Thermoleophilia bacterium]
MASSGSGPAIIARGLSREFRVVTGTPSLLRRRQRRTIHALEGLDLEVTRGERIAYIGPNGAGKSTSIRILTGILHPTSGEAEVLGHVPWRERRALSHRIGTIFGQRSMLVDDLPANSTFELHGRIYGVDPAQLRSRRDHLLELFDAAELADQQPRAMSLGQRMRCELVAALLHEPGILFLDEPTIGLDLIAKRTLRDLVVRLNDEYGTTVLLTSHDVADIETVAERVVIIDHGRGIFDGTVEQLRRDFLRSKLLDVHFLDEQDPPVQVEGCELLVATRTRVSVSVDLAVRRLGDVLDELVASRSVDDMTVGDPPLEDVIGHIYQQGRPAS